MQVSSRRSKKRNDQEARKDKLGRGGDWVETGSSAQASRGKRAKCWWCLHHGAVYGKDGVWHGMAGRSAVDRAWRLLRCLVAHSGPVKRSPVASGSGLMLFAQGVADAQVPKRSEHESD